MLANNVDKRGEWILQGGILNCRSNWDWQEYLFGQAGWHELQAAMILWLDKHGLKDDVDIVAR
jgi:hypothetical protein